MWFMRWIECGTLYHPNISSWCVKLIIHPFLARPLFHFSGHCLYQRCWYSLKLPWRTRGSSVKGWFVSSTGRVLLASLGKPAGFREGSPSVHGNGSEHWDIYIYITARALKCAKMAWFWLWLKMINWWNGKQKHKTKNAVPLAAAVWAQENPPPESEKSGSVDAH